jgi:hypothetical protein
MNTLVRGPAVVPLLTAMAWRRLEVVGHALL